MAALGEDHCEATQGQSPRRPAPGATSSPRPGEPRPSTSRAGRRAGRGSPDLPNHAGLPSTHPHGLSLGPWAAVARSVSAWAPTCSARRLHDGPAGGLLRKSRTHTGERESRRTACVQTSQHVLLDETRAQGTQPHRPLTGPGRPHLSADLDMTLFIPRTLSLSQHVPPGATHQGCSPDS